MGEPTGAQFLDRMGAPIQPWNPSIVYRCTPSPCTVFAANEQECRPCHPNRGWEPLNWDRCGESGADGPCIQPGAPSGLDPAGGGTSRQSRGQPVRCQKSQFNIRCRKDGSFWPRIKRRRLCGCHSSPTLPDWRQGTRLISVRRGPVDGDWLASVGTGP